MIFSSAMTTPKLMPNRTATSSTLILDDIDTKTLELPVRKLVLTSLNDWITSPLLLVKTYKVAAPVVSWLINPITYSFM